MSTATELLQAVTAPEFNKASTVLKPLTRWGWPFSYELNKELADRWGYALDIDPGREGIDLTKPTSTASQLAELAKTNPQFYKIQTNTYRLLFDQTFLDTLPIESWCQAADGSIFLTSKKQKVLSALAPPLAYQEAARVAAKGVSAVYKYCPDNKIIVLNGGEYGTPVDGASEWVVDRDIKIRNALGWTATNKPSNAVLDEFFSRSKANQEQYITDLCSTASNGADYIYYVTGDARKGISSTHWAWAWNYRWMRHISDYPSWQAYYGSDGTWTWGTGSMDGDILTIMLDAVGQGIQYGNPLMYNWVCGGWITNKISPDSTYEGFLKCLYTAGTIGACAGYFKYPDGGFNGDVGTTAPDWLRQLMILSKVHALFSYQEDFLVNGKLLSNSTMHMWNKEQPCYEFTSPVDKNARVLVRKHNTKQYYLVTTWAADGTNRNITIDLPEIGTVTLAARAQGAVYKFYLSSGVWRKSLLG